MYYFRRLLRLLAYSGLGCAGIALILSVLNIINSSPLDLHRSRDIFLGAAFFAVIYILSFPSPGLEACNLLKSIRRSLERPKTFYVLASLTLFLYLADALTQHLAFQTASHDFSMIDEALALSGDGQILFSPVLGRSFFSEHFSPVLLLLIPLKRVISTPWLLVVLQPLILFSAVFPLRAFLLRFCNLTSWQNNLLSLLFLHHAIMISTCEYLFHMECFLPVALISALYFAEKRNYYLYALFIILTLSIKEDAGLYLFGLGLFYALLRRRWLLGASTMIAGGLATILAVKFAIPYFSHPIGEYPFASRWDSWGQGAGGILIGFVSQPFRLALRLFNKEVVLLFASFLFVPFLKLRKAYWMLFLIPWVINATSDFPMQSQLKLYYGIPVFTFMVAAVIFALQDKEIYWPKKIQSGAIFAIILVLLNLLHFKFPHIPRERSLIIENIAMLESSEPVMTSACYFPILGYNRVKLLIEPGIKPQYNTILLNNGEETWPLTPKQNEAFLASCLNSGYYIKQQQGDFILLSL